MSKMPKADHQCNDTRFSFSKDGCTVFVRRRVGP
jgi:hypothetical protein